MCLGDGFVLKRFALVASAKLSSWGSERKPQERRWLPQLDGSNYHRFTRGRSLDCHGRTTCLVESAMGPLYLARFISHRVGFSPTSDAKVTRSCSGSLRPRVYWVKTLGDPHAELDDCRGRQLQYHTSALTKSPAAATPVISFDPTSGSGFCSQSQRCAQTYDEAYGGLSHLGFLRILLSLKRKRGEYGFTIRSLTESAGCG